ncbi:Uncharacterized protein FWK35_00030032, partial [Aphis craccivora]
MKKKYSRMGGLRTPSIESTLQREITSKLLAKNKKNKNLACRIVSTNYIDHFAGETCSAFYINDICTLLNNSGFYSEILGELNVEKIKIEEDHMLLNHRIYVFYIPFWIKIITIRNNTPISNFGGGFRCKSEYPWYIIEVKSKHFPTVFKKIEKNKKKITEKREFLPKTSFRPNQFFYMV